MFTSPGDIIFSIGSISLYYYGVMMGLAILSGILTAYFITKHFYKELNPDIIFDIAPYIIMGGIIGARLYYCILSASFYLRYPFETLKVWHGGLSIQGALIGGLIAGIIYTRKHNLPSLKLGDIFACATAFAQGIGRWGNFFNSEAFGLPTNLPWKLYIPYYKRPQCFMEYDFFHPTFLYESVANFLMFSILVFMLKKFKGKYSGIILASHLIIYSAVRLLIEQIRLDSVLDFGTIHVAQIMCIILILAALGLILFILKTQNKQIVEQ